jgi:hypothetical protein
MTTQDLLSGLDAVEIDRADDKIREQTQEAFREDSEHGEALRAAQEIELSSRETAYELYSQFCGMMESIGADVPDEKRQKRTAKLLAKTVNKHAPTLLERVGVEGILLAALLGDWGSNLATPIQNRIESIHE